MGPGKRAYDLLRGYVNQEWERIRQVDESPEERELRESLEVSTSYRKSETVEVTYVEIEPTEWARRVLGVSTGASFEEIKKAFERLNSRSDPANFPEGSGEAKQALEIQLRVQKAYVVLSDTFDATEKRFKSLEID